MKQLLYTLIILLTTAVPSHAASADNIIERFIHEFEQARSITLRYTIKVEDAEPVDGIMCLRGEKFKINSAPIAVWYDGTTQWTYTADTGEVSITEPTPEEIADINPFVIINGFRHGCKSTVSKSDSLSDTVTMTPLTKESGIETATIVFAKSTGMPESINIALRSGAALSLKINSITRDINYPSTTFVFNKDKYPKATIVDLR